MKTAIVEVLLPGRAYPVYIGQELSPSLPGWLRSRTPQESAAVVTDRRLARGIAGRLLRAIRTSGRAASLLTLPEGEKAKDLRVITDIYAFLLEKGARRRTPLVAVGGGSIGDAAGFAAATFYRGIPLVHVPTTLLAQVDSSIGGKTAVDLPGAKNAVGAFHQPAFVVCDVGTLASLSERQFLSGMAEVVKYALVFDRTFASWLDKRWEDILRRDPTSLRDMVAACVGWKARIVAQDERDLSGQRELLNFGHTLGHAFETLSGYRLLHGEGVAWGMRAAAALSRDRGWLVDPRDARLGARLLERLPAPALRGMRGLSEALSRDKKMRGSRNVFILLEGIGRPRRVDDVSGADIRRTLMGIGAL
ncbi:MAG: 3-dehydroquinate synthase [Elusimicrobiota bacterium]